MPLRGDPTLVVPIMKLYWRDRLLVSVGLRRWRLCNRGGGAVEAEAIERGPETPQVADPPSPYLSLSAAGGESLPLKTAGTGHARLIPRERFCALARGGATVASTAPDGLQGFAPVAIADYDLMLRWDAEARAAGYAHPR